MKKSVIEKFNAALDRIERSLLSYVEKHGSPPIGSLKEIHQDHQAVLYFRDVLARRHAEPVQDAHLCRDEAIEVLNKLITYHTEHTYLCIRTTWSVGDHRAAIETIKSIRDHLERCYEIRSRGLNPTPQ